MVRIVLLQKQTFETTDIQLRMFDWAGDFKDEQLYTLLEFLRFYEMNWKLFLKGVL